MRQWISGAFMAALLLSGISGLSGCGGSVEEGVPADAFKGPPPPPIAAGPISPKDLAAQKKAAAKAAP